MHITVNTRALATPTPKEEIARVAEMRPVHEAFRFFQLREGEFRRLQLELARIPAPPFGERNRAEWLAARFRDLGLEDVEIDKAGNVLALRSGSDPKAKLVTLTAHIDTVFPEGTPLNPKIEANKLFGPGVSDNAAGVIGLYAIAAGMKAASLKHRAGILFVGNVGEEGEGDLRGMRHLFSESKYKAQIGPTIVLDGAGNDSIVTQALGSRRFEVIVRGPGGHSWSDFGVPNPIIVLARAITSFSDTQVPADPKTSFNIGVIEGGTSVNSIPESAHARVDIRSASPGEIDRLEKALQDAVARAVKQLQETRPNGRKPALSFEIRPIGSRPAADLRPESRILAILRAVDTFLHLRSNVRRASTDANIPLSLGREAVSIGAGGTGGGAHTLNEWFDASNRDLGLKRILLAVGALAGVE
jgi:acetylornithine deacetylase/succinyl-diaminopimelate desuccinylase-like protein